MDEQNKTNDKRMRTVFMKTRGPGDLRTNSRIPEEQRTPENQRGRGLYRVMKSRDQRTGKKKNRGPKYQKIK